MDRGQTAWTLLDAECAGAVNLPRSPIATKMRTAVALGSNIGDRLENLRAARKAIFDLANVKPPILSSAVYETEPVGCEPGAGKFLNAVVEFEYEGDPRVYLSN